MHTGKRVQYRRRRSPYRWAVLLLILLGAVAIGCAIYHWITAGDADDGAGAADPGTSQSDPSDTGAEEPSAGDGTMPEAGADGTVQEPDAEEEPPAADETYTFGSPVAEGEAVDDSWFEDAVFLGDSRTEGLQLYSGITAGTFFWEWGMSVFKIDDTGHRKVAVNGEKMTLMEALSTGTWNKVYIMIGINDLGYQASSYHEALGKMIDRVREIQSGAVIYLQTMPPVNDAMAQKSGLAYYVNNENVTAFNEAIVQVAQEKQVVLLDTAQCLTGSDGQLPADMSSDGVHFKRAGYETWLGYLKSHTLRPEDVPAQAAAGAASTTTQEGDPA